MNAEVFYKQVPGMWVKEKHNSESDMCWCYPDTRICNGSLIIIHRVGALN